MTNNNRKCIRTYHAPDCRWSIHHGEVETVLPTLSNSLYDGSLFDPPYALKYMGEDWDQALPPVEVFTQILKVCKPGAYMLAFGHPKTFHRLMVKIEEAGWKIRDTLSWIHGEGMPKGLNLGRPVAELGHEVDWNGYGTTLKPAWEPIVLAQKPCREGFARNAVRFGCGGLNIHDCRIQVAQSEIGRWPANLLLDNDSAELIDQQSGMTRSRQGRRRQTGSNVGNGRTMNPFKTRRECIEGYDDEGGASRFFYASKAKKERIGNEHPTVKPTDLCQYLARLILPPQRKSPRRLLVPYSGSGSEMIGALSAGWDCVTGIEMEERWVATAQRRLKTINFQISKSLETGNKPRPTISIKESARPIPKVNTVEVGDCRDLISSLADNSINLGLTSPPYAEQRKDMYPGVPENEYPEFTVDWMAKLWDKLTDDGSVLIIIRPHLKDGVVSDYVLRTRLALREFGWKECEELIWYKPDGGNGSGSIHRPKRAFEHILWFSKTNKPFVDTKACGKLSDRLGFQGKNRFGLGPNLPYHTGQSSEMKTGKSRSADVIHVSVAKVTKGIMHPAMFPIPLAEQLIKTFCPVDGTVLDNFCGSGSTCLAAKALGRKFYGFDIKPEYVEIARKRLNGDDGDLFTTCA